MDGTDGAPLRNFTTGDPSRCVRPPDHRPGELVPAGSGRWAPQPSSDPRGWPRFFMPAEAAQYAAAKEAYEATRRGTQRQRRAERG